MYMKFLKIQQIKPKISLEISKKRLFNSILMLCEKWGGKIWRCGDLWLFL